MARPRKSRIVSSMPTSEGFVPIGFDGDLRKVIIMTVEEYEAIRLLDHEGMNQEECGASMSVSRPTVTNIYDSARRKIADALINERVLLIEGGDYNYSRKNKRTATLGEEKAKMKIAVTYENGQIFQHFGHCENFKVYDVEDGRIVSSRIENAAGSGHGALAGFLKDKGIGTLICGGIGGGARVALTEAGIQLFGGVSGDADAAAEALVNGSLQYSADPQCSGHEGHDGGGCHGQGEGHNCSGHGHGGSGCGHSHN